jgi:hypothetical protein
MLTGALKQMDIEAAALPRHYKYFVSAFLQRIHGIEPKATAAAALATFNRKPPGTEHDPGFTAEILTLATSGAKVLHLTKTGGH